MRALSKRILGAAVVIGGFALAGCEGPTNVPLVSGQYPPAAESSQSEPQPLGSLPRGAANVSSAPGATHPQYLAWTFRAL